MTDNREILFQELWKQQDHAYDLMIEYDGIPHLYGSEVMYHAEGLIIDLIAEQPGITCTEIAAVTKKTSSACSQLVRKLRDREYVFQSRNEKNNRIYNLFLTEKGEKVYKCRREFSMKCQEEMRKLLKEFSQEELQIHIAVQKKINEAYKGDVERSRACISK